MDEGGTNDMVKDSVGGAGTADGVEDGDPKELSRGAAVAAAVLAGLCGAAVLLAVFHWLGWSVPGIGWLVAKLGIKLAVGGFAAVAVGLAWLRARLRPRSRT
ncbi:hypothetical protein ACIRD3_06680 [Kitasatospora sp. NPDC093550]|uniref:hypothetical protein n=1 Tax=Kitasatospora sp. NPDC093550 TaxID=3364089 RepID=UPI00380DE0D4